MDALTRFITPDCYDYKQMQEMGWTKIQIDEYCKHRANKWRTATEIFRSMFHQVSSVLKEFNYQESKMVVYIYDHNYKQICYAKHVDPLFALAECAKMLNNEEDFISNLLCNLQL